MLKELLYHKAYDLINNKYKKDMMDNIVVDYVILDFSNNNYNKEYSHKEAVIEAIKVLNIRNKINNFTIDIDNMECYKYSSEELFELPKSKYYKDKVFNGNCRYRKIYKSPPYWYAFLEPAYPNSFTIKDFNVLNDILFPFKGCIEIYRWNDDFSSYFDYGKEWWGTLCISVYDFKSNVFTVILASDTD